MSTSSLQNYEGGKKRLRGYCLEMGLPAAIPAALGDPCHTGRRLPVPFPTNGIAIPLQGSGGPRPVVSVANRMRRVLALLEKNIRLVVATSTRVKRTSRKVTSGRIHNAIRDIAFRSLDGKKSVACLLVLLTIMRSAALVLDEQ